MINETKMREIKKETEAIQQKFDREYEGNLIYQLYVIIIERTDNGICQKN